MPKPTEEERRAQLEAQAQEKKAKFEAYVEQKKEEVKKKSKLESNRIQLYVLLFKRSLIPSLILSFLFLAISFFTTLSYLWSAIFFIYAVITFSFLLPWAVKNMKAYPEKMKIAGQKIEDEVIELKKSLYKEWDDEAEKTRTH